jgi:hypothetical protein
MTRAPITPRVSEHALLRYLERVYGLDVEALRREILTPEICGQIAAGAVTVTIRGHKAPVEYGCTRTVLPLSARIKTKNHKARHTRAAQRMAVAV